jgi:two-component system, NtrC family, nitrogen regulation sensor histidine kinase NtrY
MIFRTQQINFLILSILFFVIAILGGAIMKSTPDRARQVDKVQNYLNAKTISLEQIGEELLSDTSLWRYDEFFRKYELDNDASFLIYHNDRLVFWTDNTFSEVYYENITRPNSLFTTNTAYYLANSKTKNDITIVSILLIAQVFTIENQFVKSGFNEKFCLSDDAQISLNPFGPHSIKNINEEFLFSIEFGMPVGLSETQHLMLLVVYLIGFGFLIAFLFRIYSAYSGGINRRWSFILLVLSIILIRVLSYIFEIPAILYDSRIFGPSLLAIHFISPSLGDLLLNVFVIAFISFFFYRSFSFTVHTKISRFRKYFLAFSLLFHVYIFYAVYTYILERIIFDSIISLSADRILEIRYYDFLALIVLGLISISYLLVSLKLIRESLKVIGRNIQFYILLLLTTTVYLIVHYYRNGIIDLTIILIVVLVLYVAFNIWVEEFSVSLKRLIYPILLLSVASSIHITRLNQQKDIQNRKQYAIELAYTQDRILEYRFSKIEQELLNDSVIIGYLSSVDELLRHEDILLEYIRNTYLSALNRRYDFTTTLCYNDKTLRIRPDDYIIDCKKYFSNYIHTVAEPTDVPNLYYIFPGLNYISGIQLTSIDNDNLKDIFLYIDVSAKSTTQGLGYPELLLDERGSRHLDLYNYSYGIYFNRNLIRSFGKYAYPTYFTHADELTDSYLVFNENSSSHVLYKADNQNVILISRENEGLQQLMASYSYTFLIMFLVAGTVFLLAAGKRLLIKGISYKNRIQFSIIGLVVVSFIFIGFTTVLFLISLNDKKNLSILSERNHSVLMEVEQFIADNDTLDHRHTEALEDFLLRLSMTFFSDINIFDTQGALLASSRPQIFEEGLISRRLHPRAFHSLINQKESFFIQEESIIKYVYLSSYLPFRNFNNEIIGYVNLPYFARQNDLRQEIAAFLVAYINIYVVLIGAGILIAILLTGHLLKPLNLLKQSIANIKLRESSQKIIWKRDDEIGDLLREYNRMTEELAKSAELLASSERESAWREMARQVAHEIKNPLTPMKLSTQHLLKSWNDGTENWDERLKRYSESIIKQIDTLSDIASAFSDFALMPVAKRENVDLVEVIQNAQSLYQDLPGIRISTSYPAEITSANVFADRRQLLRVFNNLLKNSVEAIEDSSAGVIALEILEERNYWIVLVSDNGSGIDEIRKQNIFKPYFTTKSGGMGLGLAIVKSIVNSFDGEISFESHVNRGTIFSLHFPKIINTAQE